LMHKETRNIIHRLTVITAVVYFGNALWQTLFVIYLDKIGISSVNIGLSSSLLFSVPSLLAFMTGMICDSYDKRKLITASLAISSTLLLLMPSAKDPLSIMGIALLYGLMMGFFAQSAIAIIAYSSDLETRATAYSIYYFTNQLLSTVGTFASGPIVETYGYEALYGLGSLSFMIGAIMTLAFLPSLPPYLKEEDRMLNSIRSMKRLLLEEGELRSLMIAIFFHDSFVFIAVPFITLFAKEALFLSESRVSLLIGVRSLGQLASQIVCGKIADRIGGDKLLLIHVMATGILYAIYGQTKDFVTAMIVMVLFGLSFALDMPARRALLSMYSPEGMVASVNGLADTLVGLGTLPSPIIGGYMWQLGRMRQLFTISGLGNLLAIPFIVRLIRKRNGAWRKGAES